jgi:hypothetical protein
MEAKLAFLEQQLKTLIIGTKMKDLSQREHRKLISKPRSVTEFLAQIEQYARVCNWTDSDVVNIAHAKLAGEALQFVNGRDNLIETNATCEILKSFLLEISVISLRLGSL